MAVSVGALLRRFGAVALVVTVPFVIYACAGSPDHESENLGSIEQAATLTSTQTRIAGFEQLSDWSVSAGTGTLSLGTDHVEGAKALVVSSTQSVSVQSIAFGTVSGGFRKVDVQLKLPSTTKAFLGVVQITLVSATRSVNVPIGRSSLSVAGGYNNYGFIVPRSVVTALTSSFADLRIVVEVTLLAPAAILIDKLQLSGATADNIAPPWGTGSPVPAGSYLAYSSGDSAPPVNATTSVTRAGALVETVPIEVPPGRAGMQPSLSIVYNSNNPNGPLGVGFALQGISKIERCPWTPARDGNMLSVRVKRPPINFCPDPALCVRQFTEYNEAVDNFCLDGQKLVKTAGTKTDPEFRTEQDTFVKVTTSYGGKYWPSTFKVYRKDGSISTYDAGPTATGYDYYDRVTGAPTAGSSFTGVVSWHIARTEDRFGNAVDYTYQSAGPVNGGIQQLSTQELVKQIDYTTCAPNSACPYGGASNRIRFEYEERPDILGGYVAGLPASIGKRLTKMRAEYRNPSGTYSTQHVYLLKYELSAATERSRLKQIDDCPLPPGEQEGTTCRPPLTFTWGGGQGQFFRRRYQVIGPDPAPATPPSWQCKSPVDAAHPQPGCIWVDYKQSGDASFPNPKSYASSQMMWIGDFDGNGSDDFTYTLESTGHYTDQSRIVFTQRNGLTGDTTLITKTLQTPSGSYNYRAPSDIDQDGQSEMFTQLYNGDPANQQLENFKLTRWAPATSTFEPISVNGSDYTLQGGFLSPPSFVDVNGDGFVDLFYDTLVQRSTSTNGDYWSRVSQPTAVGSFPTFTAPQSIYQVGSGLPFNAEQNTTFNTCSMRAFAIANGSTRSFFRHCDNRDTTRLAGVTEWTHYLDVNGDGNDDAVLVDGAPVSIVVRESTGVSLSIATGNVPEQQMKPSYDGGSPTSIPADTSMLDPSWMRPTDFDGDGQQDIVQMGTKGTVGDTYEFTDAPVVLLSRNRQNLGATNCGAAGTPCKVTQLNPISLPFHGKRIVLGKLADFNGDGLPDIIQGVHLINGGAGNMHNGLPEFSYQLQLIIQDPGNRDDVVTIVTNGALSSSATYFSGPTANVDTDKNSSVPQCAGQHCTRRLANMVVRTEIRENGAWDDKRYYYGGPVSDVSGRGFVGFATVSEWDVSRAQSLVTSYGVASVDGSITSKHSYPWADFPILTQWKSGPAVATQFPTLTNGPITPISTTLETRSSNTIFVTQIHRTNSGLTYFPETTSTTTTDLDSAGTAYRKTSRTATFDDFGNATKQAVGVDSGETLETSNVFSNDASSWLIGRQTNITQTSTRNSETQTRILSYTYTAEGAVKTETSQPADATLELVTTLTRDTAGLVRTSIAKDKLGNVRTGLTDYDKTGTFVEHAQDGAGHDSWAYYEHGIGLPLVTFDAAGRRTDLGYDNYARPVSIKPTGQAAVSYSYNKSTYLGTGIAVTKTVDGSSPEVSDVDDYGRLRRNTWKVDNSATPDAEQFYGYDVLGRLTNKNPPQFKGQTTSPPRTSYSYDNLGTMRLRTDADGAKEQVSYITPLQTQVVRTTSAMTSTTLTTRAPDGLVTASVQTAAEGTRGLTSVYGPFGQLRKVTEDSGPTKEYQYDALGRRTVQITAESGKTEIGYTGFGEVNNVRRVAVTPASVTSYVYDAVGRMTQSTADGQVTYFGYDLGANGIGQLGYSLSPDGVYQVNDFDSAGHLSKQTLGDSQGQYSFAYTYDAKGRLSVLDYPDVGAGRLQVNYEYDPVYGSLQRVYDNSEQWYANLERDVLGRPLKSTIVGNSEQRTVDSVTLLPTRIAVYPYMSSTPSYDVNYRYYTGGNPSLREEKADLKTDEYYYNGFNELKSWVGRDNGAIVKNLQYNYDKLGNPTGTTDGSLIRSFGTGNAAHQVTGQPNFGQVFAYDALGRQTDKSTWGTKVRHIDYTSFDLPRTMVSQPLGQSTAQTFTYAYDAGQRRYRKSEGSNSTTYLGDLIERRVTPTGTKAIVYVWADGRRVGQRTYDVTGGTFRDVPLMSDAQGSVTAALTNGGLQRTWYGPWGDKFQTGRTSITNVTVGFTGHEQDDEAGLVNMQGRIYDPYTSMFLTADPFIQRETLATSHNPYVYARNNPTTFTDPLGFMASVSDGSFSYGVPFSPYLGEGATPEPSAWTSYSSGPGIQYGPVGTNLGFTPGSSVESSSPTPAASPSSPTPFRYLAEWVFWETDWMHGLPSPLELAVRPWVHPRSLIDDVNQLRDTVCGLNGGCEDAWAPGPDTVTKEPRPEAVRILITTSTVITILGPAKLLTKGLGKALSAVERGVGRPRLGSPGGPKVGSAGGPGAGKPFAEATKDAGEQQAGGKCVFCQRNTTRVPGGTQRNADHAIPKSRGGNNTLDNVQNTCRDCNLDKSTMTTEEYLESLRQEAASGP